MVAGLDSWQAMELDVALALKYSTLEREEARTHTETLLYALDNVVRAQGAKLKKRKPSKSLIKKYVSPKEQKATDELPLVDDVIRQLTGGLTVVKYSKKEE